VLGDQIAHLCKQVLERGESNSLVYGAVRFSQHPSHVFMVLVGQDYDPQEACVAAADMTLAACAYYEKAIGIYLLIDQQGQNIRYGMGRIADVQHSIEHLEVGREYFEDVQPRRVELVRRQAGSAGR
jgi:hypothetical protein